MTVAKFRSETAEILNGVATLRYVSTADAVERRHSGLGF